MERDSQYKSLLVNNNVAGECSCYDDTANFNSMFSTVSLLSLLTAGSSSSTNHEALLSSHPLYGDFGASPASFVFLGDGVTPLSTSNFLGLPKPEPLTFGEYETKVPLIPTPTPSPMPPFNFMFPDSSSFSGASIDSQVFHHLPDLLSLDHFSAAAEDHPPPPSSSLGRLRKRARAESLSRQHAVNQQASSTLPPPSPIFPRRSALARQRRQKLSDKTRCLQKLLPWDKKMDTATMLEEAYKYVKFLQAQLVALKSMPAVSSSILSSSSPAFAFASQRETIGGSFGVLGRLNRNQLLQVLVNSPVAQTTLSSKGCCVFSVEQLGLLERLADMSRVGTSNARISSLPQNRF